MVEKSEPERVKEMLRQIKHPEMDLDIVELGMIGNIRYDPEKTTIVLRLPFRKIPMKRAIMTRIEEILSDRVVEIKTCLMSKDQKSRFFILAGENWGH